ncbi:MAG: Methyltransferase type 11 [Bacteroidetes bacterium]|nr:Methyltransferase type 11 [Bacteroidota bacterium]
MSNPYFKFKQFTIFHDKCAMKVGADGVTLGAWTDVAETENLLDVGTGSGLIALMLAQRCNAQITMIDIDNECVTQATENAEHSPWKDRISAIHSSFQDFAEKSTQEFDLIVCNPPFFINSLQSPSETRTTARHNNTLSQADLISCSKKLLSDTGRLCLILPISEGNQFLLLAKKSGLFCSKKTSVFPNYEKAAKRLLLEFKKTNVPCTESNLTIEQERNIYTPEYAEFVKIFYLKL